MKNIALLLIIVLSITVSAQAQTVQKKNYLLKSHVIKKQNNSTTKKINWYNGLADSLTVEERLMMIPIRNDLYFRINAPLKPLKPNI